MADLYSLVHREAGPRLRRHDARRGEDELAAVLQDEPDWRPEIWMEPLLLVLSV